MENVKMWLTWAGLSALFLAMIYGIFLIRSSEISNLRNNGFPANAEVVNKQIRTEYSSSSSNNRKEVAYVTVTFMDKSSTDPDKIVDVGRFQRAEFEVLNRSYEALNIGDEVEVLFIPDEIDEIMLAAEVEEWNPIGLYLFMGPFALSLIVCLAMGLFSWLKALYGPVEPKPMEMG